VEDACKVRSIHLPAVTTTPRWRTPGANLHTRRVQGETCSDAGSLLTTRFIADMPSLAALLPALLLLAIWAVSSATAQGVASHLANHARALPTAKSKASFHRRQRIPGSQGSSGQPRIAICYTGGMRTFEDVWQSQRDNLFTCVIPTPCYLHVCRSLHRSPDSEKTEEKDVPWVSSAAAHCRTQGTT
jgi:hypothetical protein